MEVPGPSITHQNNVRANALDTCRPKRQGGLLVAHHFSAESLVYDGLRYSHISYSNNKVFLTLVCYMALMCYDFAW